MRQRAVIVLLVLMSAFATYYFGREALIAAVSLCVGIFVETGTKRSRLVLVNEYAAERASNNQRQRWPRLDPRR